MWWQIQEVLGLLTPQFGRMAPPRDDVAELDDYPGNYWMRTSVVNPSLVNLHTEALMQRHSDDNLFKGRGDHSQMAHWAGTKANDLIAVSAPRNNGGGDDESALMAVRCEAHNKATAQSEAGEMISHPEQGSFRDDDDQPAMTMPKKGA
nr:hypothetical protein Iba_chr03aCG8280 [Ipomoea batatas]